MPLVFAYGSLAGDVPGGRPARLEGFGRGWGVAMDNAVDLPRYKHYVDPRTGKRPRIHVAFVDLAEEPGAVTDGLLLDVGDAELALLDARERNYARRRVDVDGTRAWVYTGRPDSRSRLRRALTAGTAVVARGYLARVPSATPPPPCPVADLVRVDA